MKKNKVFSLKISLIVIMAVLMLNCSQKQAVKMPLQKVNVVIAQQKDVTEHAYFVGQVYGFQDISIRARVDGFLDDIHFKEGFPVKKGQLLYSIDPEPFEAEIVAYKSNLAAAKTQYAKAQGDLNRYKPLAESNAVSQSDLDAAQAQFDAAVATVQAAEANLDLAKIRLSYTKIKSPIRGIIGKTQVDIGEYVSKMPSVILNTVSQIDEILVEFFLPENQYLQLMKNIGSADSLFSNPSRLRRHLELVLADGSIHESKGYVSFLDRAVDSNTGALLIQTSFDNKNRIVRPGQYAKIKIPIPIENAIVIPQKCVIELQGQYSVFVVNSENKVESKQIETGSTSGDLWIIKDGLKAGDKVIIDGIQKVRNGVEVEATEIEFISQNKSI
jgi:membrane fusion protein (multidrug efflux system)